MPNGKRLAPSRVQRSGKRPAAATNTAAPPAPPTPAPSPARSSSAVRAGEAFRAAVENDPDFQRWWHSDERRRKWESLIAELDRRVAAGHETWQSFVGEPMPTNVEEIAQAAVRFGLPADVVLRGNFTLADVTTFMVGKRLAAADEHVDRLRAVAAEAVVRRAGGTVTPGTSPAAGTQVEAADDEYAGIARRLSDHTRSVLRYLFVNDAFDRASLIEQHGIAVDLEISFNAVRAARRELCRAGQPLLESASGRKGGVWLTPAGKLVAARVPASTCRQPCLAETSTKKHQTGGA